jgi:hypothetical protein
MLLAGVLRGRPGDLSELQLRRNVPGQRASRVQKRDVGLRGKASQCENCGARTKALCES